MLDSLFNEESIREERGKTRGKNESRGRNKSKVQGRSQSCTRTLCYYCNKQCHKRFECRSPKRDQKARTVHPNLVDPNLSILYKGWNTSEVF